MRPSWQPGQRPVKHIGQFVFDNVILQAVNYVLLSNLVVPITASRDLSEYRESFPDNTVTARDGVNDNYAMFGRSGLFCGPQGLIVRNV